MDRETRLLLGKILGELYRMQKGQSEISASASESHIFALRNGFQHAIKEELDRIGDVPEEKVKAVMDVLDPIWQDEKKLEEFRGFYDIERDLSERGVSRSDAIKILKFLHANGQFTEVISKMDSSHSPAECRKFDLREWD